MSDTLTASMQPRGRHPGQHSVFGIDTIVRDPLLANSVPALEVGRPSYEYSGRSDVCFMACDLLPTYVQEKVMKISRVGSSPSGKAPAENFTGTVRRDARRIRLIFINDLDCLLNHIGGQLTSK